jgi:hypothetical protein
MLVSLLATLPLLALLVLEQGRVIDAQRLLIRQLNGDSQQLNSIRVREAQNHTKQGAPPAKPPQADTQQPGAQQQPGTQQRPGAAPEHKNRRRHDSKQDPPAPPQEYPGTRQVPVRKSA